MGSGGSEPQICKIWPWAECCWVPRGHQDLPCPRGPAAPPAPCSVWGRESGEQAGACPRCPLHPHPGRVPLTEVQLRPVPGQRCRPPPPRGCDPGGRPAPHRGVWLPVEGTELLSPPRPLSVPSGIPLTHHPGAARLPVPPQPQPLPSCSRNGTGWGWGYPHAHGTQCCPQRGVADATHALPPGPSCHLPQGCCVLGGRWSAGRRLPPGRGGTRGGFSLRIAAGAAQALLQLPLQPPHLVPQRPDGLAAARQMPR